jgi:hypothetical protein
MTFDAAGNATLSFTNVGAPGTSLQLPVSSGALAGTYSVNPDGSGTLTFAPPSGGRATRFSFVTTDDGSEILLLATSTGGADVWLGDVRLQ